MTVVVSDTGPINYLVLIGAVDVLPALFDRVVMPEAVRIELSHPDAPLPVRDWLQKLPAWVEVRAPAIRDGTLSGAGAGESQAIALAREIEGSLLLLDDRLARQAARGLGLNVTGTLGVLEVAARRGLIQIEPALGKLEATNFRMSAELKRAIIERVSSYIRERRN